MDEPYFRSVEDVHEFLFDPTLGDSLLSSSDELSSSDSDSDYNLSDPEAGLMSDSEPDKWNLNIPAVNELPHTSSPLHLECTPVPSTSTEHRRTSTPYVQVTKEMEVALEQETELGGVSEDSEVGQATLGAGHRRGGVVRQKGKGTGRGKMAERGGRGRGKERGSGRGEGRGIGEETGRERRGKETEKGGGLGRVRGRGRGRGRGKGVKRTEEQGEKALLEVKDLNCKETCPRSFPFTPSRSVGVHLPADINTSSPESLFKLFFDDEIIRTICKASNEYAHLMKDTKPVMYGYYKRMVGVDLYNLIGIIIHLGYCKIQKYRLAWSPESLCYDPFISRVMSRNRFEGLMSCLHVVDKETEAALKEAGDKLAKIRPLYDYLNAKCKKFYQPNSQVSIDERMVRSKARFSYKQYIRNKPTKWGFKLWCLCDSHNGYTIQFSVYRGKEGELTSKKGLGYDLFQTND